MHRLLPSFVRSSRRTRRALPLLLSAFLALSASCSTDYAPLTDGPGTPALIPGSFVLVAIDGKVVPYAPPALGNVTIISGDCVTTTDKFTLNIATVTGTATDTVTTNSAGFVLDVNKGSVLFHFSASSIQAPVLITGNGFQMTYQGLQLLFERVG